jgi:glycosyltransferase involved in cell wall biosynthesis
LQSIGKISTLMAVYNAQATIAEALRSILAQTRRTDEIIIVDDGSTDDTGPILKDFSCQHGARVITLSENRGFTAAINAGLGECRGDWVARLDADDWWDPTHLQTLEVSLATAAENSSLVATRARYWDQVHLQVGVSPGPMDTAELRCFAMNDNPFVHSAVMFRRDAACRAGGYPSSVRWEDYGLWIALMSTDNALIIDATTVNCRKHGRSLSSVSKREALHGRLEMQRRAWRLFRHACPVTGATRLARTWIRLLFVAVRARLPC